jgi:hypothetical protein
MEFECYWQIYAGACPSAVVTLSNSLAIDGTTYSAAPITWGVYPAYWTITFFYTTVAVAVATTYHTAALVKRPNSHAHHLVLDVGCARQYSFSCLR